jgi:signal transduction histidine kinase
MNRAKSTATPFATTLVRKVFSVYLAFAIALTLVQIGIEYRSTYTDLLHEIEATARAFEPGISDALWNYQGQLLDSIARGMIKGTTITAVEIADLLDHVDVKIAQPGKEFNAQAGISKYLDIFHTHGGERERIGVIILYSGHDVVFERVKFGVMLIFVSSMIKTIGLWLIIVYFVNRLLAGPLQRFTKQISSFDLASASSPPRFDLGPVPTAEMVYLRDAFSELTERAIANKHLVTQKEAAEAANLAKSRFLAAASHDLRQPMHAINLYLGTLAHIDMPQQAQSLVTKTRQCAETMDTMFRALLDMSRLDASVVRPELSEFPIELVLDRIRIQFEPEARAKKLDLRIAPSLQWVRSDPAIVERILRNFVANAVHYTERGGVVVGCRRKGGSLRLAVYDTGPGIPADKHSTVFEEFRQLGNPEHDNAKGLGLGLAIVERLARLLEAPIALKSALGFGSMFAVDLPRVEHPQGSTVIAPSKQNESVGLAGLFVVVIDDETSILDATRALLERWGCTVVTASSGAEAISALAGGNRRPDVVICDYRLRRGENGIKVIEALRDEFNESIPALLITGDTAPEHFREIEASRLVVLHKPIDEDVLQTTLLTLVGHPR